MNTYCDNDPVSGRNGYTNSGFKRCVDVGWQVKVKGSIMFIGSYPVINIDHQGHEDVNKVLIDFGDDTKLWYFVSEIEIYPMDEYPEYYL